MKSCSFFLPAVFRLFGFIDLNLFFTSVFLFSFIIFQCVCFRFECIPIRLLMFSPLTFHFFTLYLGFRFECIPTRFFFSSHLIFISTHFFISTPLFFISSHLISSFLIPSPLISPHRTSLNSTKSICSSFSLMQAPLQVGLILGVSTLARKRLAKTTKLPFTPKSPKWPYLRRFVFR